MSQYIFCAFLILLGALALYRGISMNAGQLERRRWPTTLGTILERGVQRDDRSFTKRSTLAPAVKCSYSVAGKVYTGDGVYPPPGYTEGPGPERMQRIVDGLPAQVPVHDNPWDPADAAVPDVPPAGVPRSGRLLPARRAAAAVQAAPLSAPRRAWCCMPPAVARANVA